MAFAPTTSTPIAVARPVEVRHGGHRRLNALVRVLKREPAGVLAALTVMAIVLVGVFADVVATHDPTAQALRFALRPPGSPGPNGSTYLLGSDSLGRDVFSRLVFGARISLALGVAAVLIGTVGGLLIGLFSGYRGGRVDMFIQRITDSVQAVPTIVLAMLLVASLGPAGRTLAVTAIAIGVTQIPRANRVIRSNVLSVAREEYIQAAKAIGASESRILFQHILPNVVPTTLIVFSTSVGLAIVTEATLSFLGLAAPPPLATWGGMLTIQGRQFMVTAPWLMIEPAVALSVTVLAFNFLGDSVRDVLDPRLRGKR
jgi:peptide/nickel transport system permease protein